ncbi:MAG: hypothetical protein HYR67_02315 [Bacteroidetes bacterium]|nr:hypothetical protein [Bacteroidota bacterium]
MEVNSAIGTTEKIIQRLESTKKEIEQFLYEMNHGEVTVEKQLEKLKEELLSSIREMKEFLQRKDVITESKAIALQIKLSALEEHLEKRKGDTPDDINLFLSGVKKILKEVATVLNNSNTINEMLEKIHDRLQQYRLKFDILKLKLALGTLQVKYGGKEIQHQLTQKMDVLSKFIRESEINAADKLKKFRQKVGKIYSGISKLYS